LIYSERGEPGIGGQKGDQGKKHTIHFVWRDLFNSFFFLSGPSGAPGIDGKIFPVNFLSN
jgi:hypothetical protein